MRRRLTGLAFMSVGAVALLGLAALQETSPAMIEIALIEPAGGGVVAAAPGWVEPLSEEIRLAAPLAGRLAAVLVEEGDRVARGQVIAALENAEYRAELERAEAMLLRRRAERERLVNGAREQERAEAAAFVREAAAALRTAEIVLERRRAMLVEATVGKEEVDEAEREYLMARARLEAAAERQNLVNAPPRPEDVAVAEAEVAIARANRDQAAAVLDRTFVRSPVDGVVLRKHMHSGETVLTTVEMPIVTVGDVSRLNVRADVDERDIARIRVGQRGYATAPAFGEVQFWGTVKRIGWQLGKKARHTDEPKERTDTKILEVLIELDEADRLLPGLRVDTFFVAGEPGSPG